jgi:hypothetical protein
MSVLAMAFVVLPACTWVKPSALSDNVIMFTAAEAEPCRKLGKTTVSVRANVAGVNRNADKVRGELLLLGKEAAGEMGGNAIVPVGQPENGQWTFDLYDCRF